MDRSSLDHRRSRYSMADSVDVFDDEFAVDDFTVADGFRPKRTESTSSRRSEEEEEPVMTSVAAHYSDNPTAASTPAMASRSNRNSTRKSRGMMENPFASTEDGDEAVQHGLDRSGSTRSQSTISYTPGISNRSGSSASSRTYAHTHAIPLGHGGPSHPYNMYPQDTNLARTMSTSTTTTIRPSFPTPSSPQQGPTHPYNMYTQNVEADMDDEDDEDDNRVRHPQTHIPVGFPGMQPSFHNRLTDDSMSIGGHSEQLPPYSEYPEDGAPTNITLPRLQNDRPEEPQNPRPVHIYAPFEQRRPPVSMSDEPPTSENHTLLPVSRPDGSAESEQKSKPWSEKTWKERVQTKVCGIPLIWLLFLVVAVIVIVSGTIAGVVGNNRQPPNGQPSTSGNAPSAQAEQAGSVTNTLLDASPISSTQVAPIPTGSFSLRLGSPQEVQSDCLTNSSQSAAWSCDLASPLSMSISIGYQPGSNKLGAYVYSNGSSSVTAYGVMPPQSMWSPLQLVTDMDNTQAGPAFQFQVFYPKVVVAEPSAFWPYTVGSAENGKRDSMRWNSANRWHSRRERTVPTGQQPWFCYWNSTLLEGFIYIQQHANYTRGPPGSAAISMTGITPTPAPTPAMTGSAMSFPPPPPPPPPPFASASSSGNVVDPWEALQLYPFVVKLEERRIAGSPTPYCEKKQILDDYQAGDLPYTVSLDESDPGWKAYASSGLKARTTVDGSCHCQWTSGSS